MSSIYETARDKAAGFGSKVSQIGGGQEVDRNGLPLAAPSGDVNPPMPTDSKPPMPKEPSYKDTKFYHHWTQNEKDDFTFATMVDSMAPLVATLREDVRSGEMPMSVAQKRVTEAMGDHRHNAEFDKQRVLETLQDTKLMGKVEGNLKAEMQRAQEEEEEGVQNGGR